MHARAAEEIDKRDTPLDPVRRLVIARKHQLPAWRLATYVAMCKMEDLVSDDDAEVLGARETARLARARTRIQRKRTPSPPAFQQWGFQPVMEEVETRTGDEVIIKVVKEVFEL